MLTFTQGGQLRYVDPRTFGELFVTAPDELTKDIPELAALGMDPVDEPIPWVKFREMLLSRTTKLKPLLMDQSFIAGLGNIYSDEILWEAGLRHDRTPQTLSTMEIRRLYRAIVEVLHEAVKHRGSTLGRSAVRRPARSSRRVPVDAPGLRPRRSGVPAVPHHDRPREARLALDLLLPELPDLTPSMLVRRGPYRGHGDPKFEREGVRV